MNAAHLHLILNHVPVLGGFAILVLVVLAVLRRNESIAKLSLQLMVLVGLVSLIVFFTGEPTEEIVEHLPGVSDSVIDRHEDFALYSLISTELLAIAGFLGLLSLRKFPQKIFDHWIIIALVALVNVGLMTVTANFGGQIRHTEIRQQTTPSEQPNR